MDLHKLAAEGRIEEFERQLMDLDSQFSFKCRKCGKCCKHQNTVLFNSKDIFQIAQKLQMTPEEVINEYAETYIGSASKIPVVHMVPRGKNEVCPLLKDGLCSIHDCKPTVCALFPLGRVVVNKTALEGRAEDINQEMEFEVKYMLNDIDCGSRKHVNTVRDWLARFGIPEHDEFFLLWSRLECDESAVMLCLANTAQDKVEFCRKYGVEIAPTQWPSQGLPHEIITDKGSEFFGSRMQELCQKYGVEIQSLPPFRPDGKGLVEKSFDLIQQRYKPLLRGKGVIEPDAQERWAVDYRSQSMLNLDEFTQIVIYCVLYLNAGRTLNDATTPAQKWLDSGVSLLDVPVQELLLMSLPREAAKLTRKGLRINGLLYVPADMEGFPEKAPPGGIVSGRRLPAHIPEYPGVCRLLVSEGNRRIQRRLADIRK